MANGLLNPINPLQGLTGVPGVAELPGQQSYVTGQGIQGGLTQLVDAISKQQNPLLAAGRTGLGFATGQQQGMQNLANFQKLRQDLMKGGLDITQSQLNIGEKQFDLGKKVSQQQNLYNLIRNLSPQQQSLALSNQDEFAKMMIGNMQLTGSTKEYEYAVANGYTGSYTDYVKEVEKYRATTFNMGGEGAYQKRLGEQLAEQDIEFVKTSKQLPFSVQKMDDTLSLIRNPKTRTGKLSGLVTNIDAIKQNFLNVDDSVKEGVGNTQLLDALLGSEVFPMIRALGIGARGLDTPAEREFLRQVMTGTIELNRDTLTKMTMIRRRQFQAIADEYNRQLKSGELSSYMKQKNLKPLELASGKNSAFIATGTDNDLNRKFSIYSDGRAYYHNPDGSISDEEVVGFDWLKYNYD